MDYKKFAIDLAGEAGTIIKKNFVSGMTKEWKSDGSPLTETDLKINKLVLDSIKREFPEHSVLSEEGDYFSEGSDYVWVCDPLDGTIPFSHGIPTCVFSLALVYKGRSIVGVVHDPFMYRMFFAESGKGAYLNDKEIFVSSRGKLENSVFGLVNWKGAPFNLSQFAESLKNEYVNIVNVSSITYMGVLVASGEFAGVASSGSKPHDAAALKVIVEEAGGKVTDLWGNEQRYDRNLNGYLVSNGMLHDTLLSLIHANVKPRCFDKL